MRCWSSSAWTIVSPMAGSLSMRAANPNPLDRRPHPSRIPRSPPRLARPRAAAAADVHLAVLERQHLVHPVPDRRSRQLDEHEAAQRRGQHRAARPPASEVRPRRKSATSSSSTSASARRISSVRSTLASAAGCSSRRAGTRPARARLRAKRGSRWMRPPPAQAVLAAVRRRLRRGSWTAAAGRPGPRARACPSSARRPGRRGEPVEHGLHLIGGGVAGGDVAVGQTQRDAVALTSRAQAWTLPVGSPARCTWSSTPRRSQSSRQNASSASASSRSP